MIKLDIAERYAKVLFDIDLKKDVFENRIWDFENMLTLAESTPSLMEFLNSPQITLDEKRKFLTSTLSTHFDEDFLQYLIYLIEKKRLDYFRTISKKYRNLVDEHLGIWEAELVTPVPLDPLLENKLVDMLEKSFDKKINVVQKIQPNIIGGSILILLNKMVDWSITGRLKKLKERLLERNHDI